MRPFIQRAVSADAALQQPFIAVDAQLAEHREHEKCFVTRRARMHSAKYATSRRIQNAKQSERLIQKSDASEVRRSDEVMFLQSDGYFETHAPKLLQRLSCLARHVI